MDYFWFQGTFFPQIKGVATGAKYSQSLAILFMAQWEEDVVYALNRPELVLWARYIDNILLLWRGKRASLDAFMAVLNRNDRGIILNLEASPTSIHFLDLKITATNNRLKLKTFQA